MTAGGADLCKRNLGKLWKTFGGLLFDVLDSRFGNDVVYAEQSSPLTTYVEFPSFAELSGLQFFGACPLLK